MDEVEFESLEHIPTYSSEIEIEKELTKIEEYKEFVDQRRKWSKTLLGVLIFLVLSNYILIFAVGLKLLTLDKDLLQVVYISFVFQILGLITIVLKFLFRKPPELV